MRIRLPSPDRISDPELKAYLHQLVQALERALERLPETPFMKDRIVVSNVSVGYTFDSSGATLAETRAALTSLITKLQENGVLP
jgi:hypothetical protein